MDILNNKTLKKVIDSHDYPLSFTTISGAHLYGFPSPDSDFDLRGVHILPVQDVVGIKEQRETIESDEIIDGMEIDLVTHDMKKFFLMLLKRNGYVLEQLYSPLILHSTPEHEELKEIAKGCITKHHSHHYLGFSKTQWKLFSKEEPPRVKPLLYVYRVLLTGIHMMRTGEVEANLVTLNQEFGLSYIDDLVEKKTHGKEKETLDQADLEFHKKEYERLTEILEVEGEKSKLPDRTTSRDALNDLLVRIRMSNLNEKK
jgi:uncharacterized protein